MRFARFLIIAAVIATWPAVSSAQANNDEQRGFWQKGAATDWSTPAHGNSSAQIVYRDYPETLDETKLRIQKEAEEAVQSAQIAIDSGKDTTSATTDSKQKVPLTREQIVAKYGAPTEPQVIRAQKDSPPEMKALFEALNSGDKELAWQYSVALAERNNRIKAVVSKATDYQLLAMEATGQRPEQDINQETEQVGASRLELRELMEKTKLEQAQKKFESEQGLTTAIVDAGGDLAVAGRSVKPQASVPQIPVDPAGKVKVLIFFNERDSGVKELGKSLKPLMEKFKADPNVSIFGLTMRSYAISGLKMIGATTSFPFPLLNGEALAPELRIQRYPTVVFLAVTSRQTYHLEGVQGAQEIEKVLNVMKGVTK